MNLFKPNEELFEETDEEKSKKFRPLPTITVDDEVIQLRVHLGVGLEIERKTKTSLNDYVSNMDLMTIEHAVAIIAISADRDTASFRGRLVAMDDFLVLIETAANILLNIVFPGDLVTAEKKIDGYQTDEYTKNDLRERLGIPTKDLTGNLF